MKENPWSNKKKSAGIVIEEKSNRSLKQYGRKAETEKDKDEIPKTNTWSSEYEVFGDFRNRICSLKE